MISELLAGREIQVHVAVVWRGKHAAFSDAIHRGFDAGQNAWHDSMVGKATLNSGVLSVFFFECGLFVVLLLSTLEATTCCSLISPATY